MSCLSLVVALAWTIGSSYASPVNAGTPQETRLTNRTANDKHSQDSKREELAGALMLYDYAKAEALVRGGLDVNRLRSGAWLGDRGINNLHWERHGDTPLIEAIMDAPWEPKGWRWETKEAVAKFKKQQPEYRAFLSTLLDHGALVDRTDARGRTALMASAFQGDEYAVKLLLDRGASPNIRDSDRQTALSITLVIGHFRIPEMLLAHGAVVDPKCKYARAVLVGAAWHGLPSLVDQLLSQGIPIDSECLFGMTALIHAAEDGNVEMTEHLLKRGADPNKPGPRNRGGSSSEFGDWPGNRMPPLHVVVRHSWADEERGIRLIKMLVAHGAKINAKDAEGRTALMWAIHGFKADLVTFLLQIGANPALKDIHGDSALSLARKHPSVESARRLLSFHPSKK